MTPHPTTPDTSALGAHIIDGGVRFGLWAPRATAVELVLVDALNQQHNHHMAVDEHGVWTVHVPGIGAGQPYGFRVHGPWDPSAGSRFNPARLLLDPYAKAIAGGVDFRGPILDHVPGDPFRMSTKDSFGAVPLSIVVEDTPAPTPIAQRRPMSETIIYETHLRGFTKMHPSVPEHLRGEMGQDAWHDGGRRLLGMYVSNDHEGFLTWFNSDPEPQRIVLPSMPWGHSYEVIWHSGDDGELPDGELPALAEFDIPGRTVALMRVGVPTNSKELLALKAEAEPSSYDLLP